jgi:cobyrinic acid a,c-diamide synthase
MKRLPRLALAVPREESAPSVAGLALLAGLASRGERVQHFRSRAEPFRSDRARQATGLPGRHLDAWLMPGTVGRDVFLRGMRRADLGLIEGPLEYQSDHGGACGLAPLAETLALPTLAVVPCRGLADLHLPGLPAGVDAVLLDGLERPDDYGELKRVVRLLTGRPVLGALDALPEVRRLLRRLGPDRPLHDEALTRLARSFLRYADLDGLRALAKSRPWPAGREARDPRPSVPFRVAYAHDAAFGGYFPDTLETLEGLGAELVEFSPLRSEALPPGVDLVMIGCGVPDFYAEELAANASLIGDLKHHVCRGLRIYAEGGGAAYLGRAMILGERWVPGAGILPFDAVLQGCCAAPERVVRTLSRESWLGPRGTEVRGYCSGRWSLEPAPDPTDCPARSGSLTAERDLYFRHQAIGSLVHLHLASLPNVVAAFAASRGAEAPSIRRTPSER